MATSMVLPQKIKKPALANPATPLLDARPRELKAGSEEVFAHQCSRLHDSQQPQGTTTQGPVDE